MKRWSNLQCYWPVSDTHLEGQYSVEYSVDPVGAATIKGAHTVNEGETLYSPSTAASPVRSSAFTTYALAFALPQLVTVLYALPFSSPASSMESSSRNCSSLDVYKRQIVESRDTIRANTTYIGTPDDIKIVIEKNERYTL